MKVFLLFFLFATGIAGAQTPVPAQPADPDQAIPAQPAQPAVPAVPPAAQNQPAAQDNAPTVTVLADSSLKGVLQALAQAWAATLPDGPDVSLTLTNAATMRSRLQANPATDVIIAADINDVKALTDQGLLSPDGQRSLARNTVVILGRSPLVKDDALDWFDLIGNQWKKVALGNPDLTASGRIARRALQRHDLFDDDHKDLYVMAGTEALALQSVEREQADAVFLYRTDLANVDLPGFDVMPLSSDDAPPILYTSGIGRLAKNPDGARAFLDYCAGDAARDIWRRFGFEAN